MKRSVDNLHIDVQNCHYMLQSKKKTTEELRELLQQHGLQRTKDRLAILGLLQENRTWTHMQLVKELKHTDQSTVSRNLQILKGKGIITAAHIHEGATHYEYNDRSHHDHVVCESCDIVQCIDCPTPNLPSHTLELNQLCLNCK